MGEMTSILACDPGDTTGWALAIVENWALSIFRVGTTRLDQAPTIVSQIIHDYLVIEQYPRTASLQYQSAYSDIYRASGAKKIIPLLPGLWKPVMRPLMGDWRKLCRTPHEADAIGQLIYAAEREGLATYHQIVSVEDLF